MTIDNSNFKKNQKRKLDFVLDEIKSLLTSNNQVTETDLTTVLHLYQTEISSDIICYIYALFKALDFKISKNNIGFTYNLGYVSDEKLENPSISHAWLQLANNQIIEGHISATFADIKRNPLYQSDFISSKDSLSVMIEKLESFFENLDSYVIR